MERKRRRRMRWRRMRSSEHGEASLYYACSCARVLFLLLSKRCSSIVVSTYRTQIWVDCSTIKVGLFGSRSI
eukprot:1829091-Prymnesium_polylepis.1